MHRKEHRPLQMESHEESELVRAAQQGDREAFAQLYEANVDRVYRYVRARVGEPADAEDVTAEVFIRAMNALSSYKERGLPLIAWLYRIGRNEAANFMKKRGRHDELPLLDTVAAKDDPAETAVNQVTYDEVVNGMGSLTDLQREVLSLRFAAQLSIAETAAAMSRSEQAVKFLQHSALRAMRRVLGPREEEAND